MMDIKTRFDLTERTAVITGAAGMLGRNISAAFMQLGAQVILVDKQTTATKEAEDFFAVRNVEHYSWYKVDLEDEDARQVFVENIRSEVPNLDILVNNAAFVASNGLTGWTSSFENQTLDSWRRAMEVNLTSAFHLVQGLEVPLKQFGTGSIINIGSIYGAAAPDYSLYEDTDMGNPAAYAVSKAGMIQLSRWLASTLGPEIRVNTVSPGGIYRQQDERFVERYASRTHLRRMCVEDDIVGVVAFLASDLSSYITGQNFIVDGGFTN